MTIGCRIVWRSYINNIHIDRNTVAYLFCHKELALEPKLSSSCFVEGSINIVVVAARAVLDENVVSDIDFKVVVVDGNVVSGVDSKVDVVGKSVGRTVVDISSVDFAVFIVLSHVLQHEFCTQELFKQRCGYRSTTSEQFHVSSEYTGNGESPNKQVSLTTFGACSFIVHIPLTHHFPSPQGVPSPGVNQ